MHELYNNLEEICEILDEELDKTNEKLEKAGGELSAGDLDYIDKLTHAIKSVKTTMAMLDAEDYGYSRDEEHMSYRGGSYVRGRGRNAKRDSMGRYSRDSKHMVNELRELMNDAPDEKTRMEFDRFIKKMEHM